MIDIHTHILPGMDDGARTHEEAQSMLSMMVSSGVRRVYLTPHFYPDEISQELFLLQRAEALERLTPVLKEYPQLEVRLGAEVCYSAQLLDLDLEKLTLGSDSNYLLLELPGARCPAYLVQIIEQLLGKGLTPVIAHVERCGYFRQDSELLKRLVDLGALAQVSAQALFDRRDKGFALACLGHGLAQIAASDTHNTTDRKPCMDLLRKLPDQLQQLHDAFAEAVWENEPPAYIRPTVVKKSIFGYR